MWATELLKSSATEIITGGDIILNYRKVMDTELTVETSIKPQNLKLTGHLMISKIISALIISKDGMQISLVG